MKAKAHLINSIHWTPRKALMVVPCRTSENAPLQNWIYTIIFIDFYCEKENWIPNIFSSNFDDVDRKGQGYNLLICTQELCPYAAGNGGPVFLLYTEA